MAAGRAEAWMYGDPEMHDLRAAIAAHHGVTPAHVVVGEGIDGLLGYLVRLLVGRGCGRHLGRGLSDLQLPRRGLWRRAAQGALPGHHEDPEALLAMARDRSGRSWSTWPTPTIRWAATMGAKVILAMIEAVPHGALLVLDEAYVDLAPEGTAAPVDADDPRVIRMRTFSKGYGMAGLRVGYALAAPS
jgi:histidinol-phosphate aminotransferase